MEEEAEATLSNSKSKKEWFLHYCDQYLPEIKANIQTQASPLVTGIKQWYYIINVTINSTSMVTIIFFGS